MKTKMSVPYILRSILPILGIAGASMMSSCGKDSEPEEPIQYKTTTYELDRNNKGVLDLEQIARSADSVQVETILFHVRDGMTWEGIDMFYVENNIAGLFDAAKGKGKGEGTFYEVLPDARNHSVEDKIKSYGYDIVYQNIR